MAIRKIARLGHPVLRQRAREIPSELIASPDVQQLIDDMQETMREYEGVGLAAPQVHESVRLLVTADIYDPGADNKLLLEGKVLINPEITFLTQAEEAYWEGCLSVPDLRGTVARPREITVKAYDRNGRECEFRAEGFAATVIQHEFDHLDGIVFLDRMRDLKSLSFIKEFERYVADAGNE